MLGLAIFLAAMAALLVFIFNLIKGVTDYDDEVERQPISFPSLNETVTVPDTDLKGDVILTNTTQKQLYFNINGTPMKVYQAAKSDAMYVWRNKVRNGEPYKQYLSKEQKEQCYYAD